MSEKQEDGMLIKYSSKKLEMKLTDLRLLKNIIVMITIELITECQN